MSIKYKIYSETNLLVEVISGKVTLEDLKKLFMHIINNEEFSNVNKILSNILNAEIDITIQDLRAYINLLSAPGQKSEFRWAILTTDPKHTAFSMLLKADGYFSQIVGVFSTLESCLKFLNIQLDQKEFYNTDFIVIE